MNKRSVILAASLLTLVVANLAIDVGSIWLFENYFSRSGWLDQIPISFISQLMLSALWLGLGDGRWYIRMVVAIALTLAIAKMIGVADYLGPNSSRNYDPGGAMIIPFMLMPMMLATGLFAFVLRRVRGWRLTWHVPTTSVPSVRQFQIGDALLWTTD